MQSPPESLIKTLTSLAENRVIADNLYQTAIDRIEKMKDQLEWVHLENPQVMKRYKADLLKMYRDYFTATQQIATNSQSQIK